MRGFFIVNKKKYSAFRYISNLLVCLLTVSLVFSPVASYAQGLGAGVSIWPASGIDLPLPGAMVSPSAVFVPPMLKGMKIGLEDPFAFDFILDSGNAELTQEELKQEANKLIKYFLASLTIPEDDLWVNLSPYEKDRIIPNEFGITEMGRDLLAQDYILKQLTASLIYPEGNLGKEFWDRVYSKARQLYGTEEVLINTFNKVWILPEKAVVYENETIAFVLESHLKVMLEEDYAAMNVGTGLAPARNEFANNRTAARAVPTGNNFQTEIIREIILPEIEKEVNYGKNFAKLRQVYHSLILAKWYKQNLKQSILNREYSDQKKTVGVDIDDKSAKEKIYKQYLESFKKGVFDYIKEDYNAVTRQIIPRKYFSGGLELRVPLEMRTGPLTPEDLAKADATGKLSWIKGIYRQPRVSAGFVNKYIGRYFSEGNAKEGQPIQMANGQQAQVYVVEGLLQATGQFGHIGLGVKEQREGGVVYKDDGLPVVYLDSGYAGDLTVRANEKFKVKKWEEQKNILGKEQGLGRPLTAQEMRQWIRDNMVEAAELLRAWDKEAPSLEPLFKEAEIRGDLPTKEEIAGTYTQADDFRDLNLAAGMTATKDDLVNIPTEVLHNTGAVFENIFSVVKSLESPDPKIHVGGIRELGLLMEEGSFDQRIIKELMIVKKLVKALGSGNEIVCAEAAQALGNCASQWGKWDGEIIPALLKVVRGKKGYANERAVQALGKGAAQGGALARKIIPELLDILRNKKFESIHEEVVQALGKCALHWGKWKKEIISKLLVMFRAEYSSVDRMAVVQALGECASQWGDLDRKIIPALVKALGDRESWGVREAAAKALGKSVEQWGGLAGEIISALMNALDDQRLAVSTAAGKALGKGAAQGRELAKEIISELFKILRDEKLLKMRRDGAIPGILIEARHALKECMSQMEGWKSVHRDELYYDREAEGQASENTAEKVKLQTLSIEKIFNYYSLLQKERKNQRVVSEDDINSKRAWILKLHSILEGEVDPDDVKYVGQIADITEDRDSLRNILNVIRGWAVDGSSDAQNFLEAKVGQIVSRDVKAGKKYVDITQKDKLFIESMAKSSSLDSLITIFGSNRFPFDVRIKVGEALAGKEYIDEEYLQLMADNNVEQYLDMIGRFYGKFEEVPSFEFINKVVIEKVGFEYEKFNGLVQNVIESGQRRYVNSLEGLFEIENISSEKFREFRNVLTNAEIGLRERMSIFDDYIGIIMFDQMSEGIDNEDFFMRTLEEKMETLDEKFNEISVSGISSSKARRIQANISKDVQGVRREYLKHLLQRDLNENEDKLLADQKILKQVLTLSGILSTLELSADCNDEDDVSDLKTIAILFLNNLFINFDPGSEDALENAKRKLREFLTGFSKEDMAKAIARKEGISEESAAEQLGEFKSNKEVVEELVEAGYDKRLWAEGVDISTDLLEGITQEMKDKWMKQSSYEMVEIALLAGVEEIDGQTVSLENSGELDNYEKVKIFHEKVIKVGKKIPEELSERLRDIEDYIKRVDLMRIAVVEKNAFRATIKKDFLNEVTAGVGVPGCFSPTGIHREMPIIHALEANVMFMQVYSEKGKQVGNAVIVFGKEGAYVYTGYNASKYNLDSVFGKALEKLAEYVPSIFLTTTSAGYTYMSAFTKKKDGAVSIEKPSTVIKTQYFDSGRVDEDGVLTVSLNDPMHITKDMLPEEVFFNEKVVKNLVGGQIQVDVNWIELVNKLKEKQLMPYQFLISSLKKKIMQEGEVVANDEFYEWVEEEVKVKFRGKINSEVVDDISDILLDFLKEQDWPIDIQTPIQSASLDNDAMLGKDIDVGSPGPGGIDFNLDLLELEIQGQGRDFNLPNMDRSFEHICIDDGLFPVIINITPVTNLPVILGVAESNGEQSSNPYLVI